MLNLVETPQIKHAIIDINSNYSAAFFRSAEDVLGKDNLRDTSNNHRFPQIFSGFLSSTKWPPQSIVLVTHSDIAVEVAQTISPQISVIGVVADEDFAEKRCLAAELLDKGARIIISSAEDISHSFNMLNNGYSEETAMLFTGALWHNLPRPTAESENAHNKSPLRPQYLKPVD